MIDIDSAGLREGGRQFSGRSTYWSRFLSGPEVQLELELELEIRLAKEKYLMDKAGRFFAFAKRTPYVCVGTGTCAHLGRCASVVHSSPSPPSLCFARVFSSSLYNFLPYLDQPDPDAGPGLHLLITW